MTRIFLLSVGFLAFVSLPNPSAWATLKIDVTRGVINPITIVLTPTSANSGKSESRLIKTSADNDRHELQALSPSILKIVSQDLKTSGLFQPLDASARVEKFQNLKEPSFAKWRRIQAQALAVSHLEPSSNSKNIKFSLNLWDLDSQERLLNIQLNANKSAWRRLAHRASDAIYQQLTGEEGYFNSRIVYVAETGPLKRRIKRLAIMDQDGANPLFLTDGKELVLSPRFSPTEQMITYLSYGKGGKEEPKVYILDLKSGYRQILGRFPGMTFAPRFSPDGQKVIMSYFSHDASNIYTVDLKKRKIERLTHSRFIDTAPCYSPDGRQVVFESDRSGRQQLYIMDADGRNIRRITDGEGSYAGPVWSPRGDLIAFTKMHQKEFMIGVIRPNGTGERILVRGYHNEGPTWSPNGRVLLFHRESSGDKSDSHLWAVDLTGYNERMLNISTMASDPAWSPRL